MVVKPTFGNGLSYEVLNSLEDYFLFSMEEPWNVIQDKVNNKPILSEFNFNMDLSHLESLMSKILNTDLNSITIVGLGGGTACDTAKFMTWWAKKKLNKFIDVVLIPSIISVDAFFCSSIAVRVKNKVEYVGESDPKQIIIDYDLIQQAPPYLNRAGVSDTISITSALGDWKLERDEVAGKFDQKVFDKARTIAVDLMKMRDEIRDVSEAGIKAMVEGFYKEVQLCEAWGNARPEEGSEHFLAYCLESLTGNHYIHGNLIGMNILISLFLQKEYAEFSIEEIKRFFKDILIDISPEKQKITEQQLKSALSSIQSYVKNEQLQYSIYNSPKLALNDEKIGEILDFIKRI